jgi:ankyrin repeat protein
MWASYRGHGVVVKLLLEKGANVDAKSLSGKTALDWADSDKIKKMLNEAKNKNSFLYKIKKGFGMGD